MVVQSKVAIYPGTFDPLTMGHVSLVRRALNIFDQVIVSIAMATPKQPAFSYQERVDMAKEAFADEPRVTVRGFEGLLVAYAESCGAKAILRGLRAVSDFDYEFQMALMNRRLDQEMETIFLMTDFRWLYISSTIIKEVVRSGGNIAGLVPDNVLRLLRERLGPKA